MALHACTLPIKPVARHRGSTLGPATGQHQAHRRASLGKCGLARVTRTRTAAAGHSGLGPPSSLVGHAALLRSATTAPQSAGHSAPRLGQISISVSRSLRASRRTAVRLSTRDLSCVFFVPAPPCSLTHCPNLALCRSSSSAPTSLGGQQGCLCTAFRTVCFALCSACSCVEAQLSALQAFAQVFLNLPPHRTASPSTARQHGRHKHRAAGTAPRPARRSHPGFQKPWSATHRTAGVGAGRGKDDIVWPLARSCHRTAHRHSTAPHQRPASKAASTAAPASKDPAAPRSHAAPLCNADTQAPQGSDRREQTPPCRVGQWGR